MTSSDCVASEPVIDTINYIEDQKVFIVSEHDMAELTTYIEQLEQCSNR